MANEPAPAPSSESPGLPPQVAAGQAALPKGDEPLHLLVADPEVAYLKLVELAFKRRGHQVTAVSAPAPAMAVLEREPVDILLSELHFPDGGGYGLLERAQASAATRRMPILILTKDRKARSRVRAIEIGVNDVVYKPCLLEELFVRVEGLVTKHRDLFRAAHAVKGDLAGKLSALPVGELFPMLEQSRKSGLVRLGEGGQELARVWWEDGQVVAAELGPLKGEEAVYALLPLRTGNFEYRASETYAGPHNVKHNVTSLMLEGMRRMDETLTFQFLGGRPLPGPRGAHIEWFYDSATALPQVAEGGASARPRPDARTVQLMSGAFERCFRQAPPNIGFGFSDLRQLRALFKPQTNGSLEVAHVVLVCELQDGLRLLRAFLGPPPAEELQRGLRSGVELFPTAQVPLDAQHRLHLLAAPLQELAVLARSVRAAEAFYIAPPGGRWAAPEYREGVKALLRHARPFACLPVGDGTVVEGIAQILGETGVDATLLPVEEQMAGNRLEFTRALKRLLGALGPAPRK